MALGGTVSVSGIRTELTGNTPNIVSFLTKYPGINSYSFYKPAIIFSNYANQTYNPSSAYGYGTILTNADVAPYKLGDFRFYNHSAAIPTVPADFTLDFPNTTTTLNWDMYFNMQELNILEVDFNITNITFRMFSDVNRTNIVNAYNTLIPFDIITSPPGHSKNQTRKAQSYFQYYGLISNPTNYSKLYCETWFSDSNGIVLATLANNVTVITLNATFATISCSTLANGNYTLLNSGLYLYPRRVYDLNLNSSGIVTVNYNASSNTPNKFSVYRKSTNSIVGTSNWVGTSSYNGPWGTPSSLGPSMGVFVFTKISGEQYYELLIETSTGSVYQDDWTASVGCVPVVATLVITMTQSLEGSFISFLINGVLQTFYARDNDESSNEFSTYNSLQSLLNVLIGYSGSGGGYLGSNYTAVISGNSIIISAKTSSSTFNFGNVTVYNANGLNSLSTSDKGNYPVITNNSTNVPSNGYINIQKNGSVIVADFNAASAPDCLEIIKVTATNSVTVATSNMYALNTDNSTTNYGRPTGSFVTTNSNRDNVCRNFHIGSLSPFGDKPASQNGFFPPTLGNGGLPIQGNANTKATIPDRMNEFSQDTGFKQSAFPLQNTSVGVAQQRIWIKNVNIGDQYYCRITGARGDRSPLFFGGSTGWGLIVSVLTTPFSDIDFSQVNV